MKTVTLVPDGWECSVEECPPGFFWYQGQLCFKTEYRSNGDIEVYNSAGETFMPRQVTVQPVTYEELDQ